MAGMKFYKSYSFKDKDPVIDILKTAIKDTGLSLDDTSERSGVSRTTLDNWFYGSTRRPQHATIMAVTRAIGHDWRLVKVGPPMPKNVTTVTSHQLPPPTPRKGE